jgi:hypothetical protein
MRYCKWVLAFSILGLLSGARAAPAEEIQATLEAAGFLSPGTDAARRDADLPGGFENYTPNAFVSQETDTIPAARGNCFGIRFTVRGLPAGATVRLRKVVSYPLMRRPDGSTSTGYETAIELPAGRDGSLTATEGYSLDDDFELLPGPWTIEIWLGDRRLVGKTFSLVSPPPPAPRRDVE